ncbi:MAG: GMC family oxidoreductase N-terminal domain-containing protein [Sphingomonas sp.]
MSQGSQPAGRAPEEADFIIIGAGSAGCVLANRLTADGRHTVVVLEAGADDRPSHHLLDPRQFVSSVNIHVPAGFTRMLKDPRVNWNYMTEEDPGSAGRRHSFPRGKVLGGSSSINGMLWVRGLPEDYDGWRQLGLPGWGWSDAERYFARIEDQQGIGATSGVTPGPLAVGEVPVKHPMLDAMLKGFEQAGAPVAGDLNGTTREGVARLRMNGKRGLRMSGAVAYLHPAMKRRNLRVVTGAHVARILIEGGRAVGVEYLHGGERRTIRARRETILSGGAINSPQLLELSGVGDGERLAALGIATAVHSPKVGENLQDHYASMVRARMKPGTPGFNELSRGLRLLGQMMKFAFTRTGLLATGGSNLTAFLKSDPALDLPDLQFFATPGTVDFAGLAENGVMTMEREPGVTIGGYVMRPRSRGSVHLRSPDFREAPSIRPNFLSDAADERAQIGSLKWARAVLRSPAMARYIDHELTPGAAADTDEALLAFARASGSTGYHQAATCAMGSRPDSVLSAGLKVNGVEGLRVIDASSMPNVVSGNTNAATVMIAEKGADLVLADAR